MFFGSSVTIIGAMIWGISWVYRQSCTHSDYLHLVSEAEELGRHELQEISTVVIINHVQLV